jgi:hypothetical protein
MPVEIQAKLDNRGIPEIYLGHAEDYKGDSFQFWIFIRWIVV